MRYISSLCLLICCIWLSGCQADENLRSANETGLLITLTDESDHAYARTMPSALEKPVADMFHLRVAYSGTDNVAYDDKCTESILLKEGTYDLTATYGENPVIALDAPYYIGKLESQEVVTGQMTSANISCMVGNALLSVIYNESALKKVYDTYFVTVSVGQESVDLDATSGKSAYFQAGSSVSLVFHGQLAGTGQEVSYDIPTQEKFANIPAKTHVKVTLGVDESSVSSGVGISVEKLETETVSVVETLPSEFMPKPKLEAEGFVNNELSFAETEKKTAVIRLKLASPLQDLKLKFHSTDEKFAGLEAEKEYVLSNAEDKAAIETALGIVLPDIGTTEGSLDFTSLIPLLMTDNGNTVSSTIEVDVEANNRWASEDETVNRVYTLKCNKPEFDVVVNPDNFWCKEFSIDGCNIKTGDAETISQKLQYQYRQKGSDEWLNCGQLVQLENYPTNKQFEVRAVYREGIVTDPVDVELETPQQLPNSGMEKWHTIKGETFRVSDSWFQKKTYYKFYPSAERESDVWWDTNNMRSQDGNIILGMGHPVCFAPCVSYSEDIKHGGSRSALIYTSGHGGGYASTGEMLYVKGAFAGSLFIGKYSWDNGKENFVNGHTFSSRPTSLKFWYKYVPKNQDAFKVCIELKHQDEVIATGTFIPSVISSETGWQEATVNVVYVDHPKIATSVCVQFWSTSKTSFSNSDFDQNKSISFPIMGDWNVHIGSMFYVDDISLIYDK